MVVFLCFLQTTRSIWHELTVASPAECHWGLRCLRCCESQGFDVSCRTSSSLECEAMAPLVVVLSWAMARPRGQSKYGWPAHNKITGNLCNLSMSSMLCEHWPSQQLSESAHVLHIANDLIDLTLFQLFQLSSTARDHFACLKYLFIISFSILLLVTSCNPIRQQPLKLWLPCFVGML